MGIYVKSLSHQTHILSIFSVSIFSTHHCPQNLYFTKKSNYLLAVLELFFYQRPAFYKIQLKQTFFLQFISTKEDFFPIRPRKNKRLRRYQNTSQLPKDHASTKHLASAKTSHTQKDPGHMPRVSNQHILHIYTNNSWSITFYFQSLNNLILMFSTECFNGNL